MENYEILKIFGAFSCLLGIVAAIALYFKSLFNTISKDSMLALIFLTSGGLIVGLFILHDVTITKLFAVLFLILSSISAISLLLKALTDDLDDFGSIVLCLIIIAFALTGIVLLILVIPKIYLGTL